VLYLTRLFISSGADSRISSTVWLGRIPADIFAEPKRHRQRGM